MLEWYVGITGESFDLEDLSKSLNSPEICITKKGEDYILKSTHFNSLEDVYDVRNKANEILSLINGSAWLVIGMRKPLEEVRACRVNDDGKTECSVVFSDYAHARDRFKAHLITKDGKVQDQGIFPADLIPEIISIAQNDENVATVLQLLGDRPKDWVNLYNIFEVVKKDVRKIPKEWVTKKAIRRFKQTANSVLAIRYEARHVGKIIKPPPKPMTLPEAKSFINTIIHNWIQSKK